MKTKITEKIIELKKKKNAVLLAHYYQSLDVQDVSDYQGDSLDLSYQASKVKENIIVFCGVNFMAETAKIISPQKTVLLPKADANCPMADMITPDEIIELKRKHPKASIVSYVNSTAAVKAVSDVCCTSANALKVINNYPADEFIFVPDKNLAQFCQKNSTKKIIIPQGYCYVHNKFTAEDLAEAKKNYPSAEVLVHPECKPEVCALADKILSTSQILEQVKISSNQTFLIGTEAGLIHRLARLYPNKKFYSIGNANYCINMKKITLEDVLNALENNQNIIELEQTIMKKAYLPLKKMLEYI